MQASEVSSLEGGNHLRPAQESIELGAVGAPAPDGVRRKERHSWLPTKNTGKVQKDGILVERRERLNVEWFAEPCEGGPEMDLSESASDICIRLVLAEGVEQINTGLQVIDCVAEYDDFAYAFGRGVLGGDIFVLSLGPGAVDTYTHLPLRHSGGDALTYSVSEQGLVLG